MDRNSKTFKICAIVLIIAIVACIGIVAAGKGKIVKDAVEFAVIEGAEHVVTHGKEINTAAQKIKADNGVYDNSIESYEHQIAKLQQERIDCINTIDDPNESKFNIDYAKDKLTRIDATIKSFEMKIKQCKRGNNASA